MQDYSVVEIHPIRFFLPGSRLGAAVAVGDFLFSQQCDRSYYNLVFVNKIKIPSGTYGSRNKCICPCRDSLIETCWSCLKVVPIHKSTLTHSVRIFPYFVVVVSLTIGRYEGKSERQQTVQNLQQPGLDTSLRRSGQQQCFWRVSESSPFQSRCSRMDNNQFMKPPVNEVIHCILQSVIYIYNAATINSLSRSHSSCLTHFDQSRCMWKGGIFQIFSIILWKGNKLY